MTCCRRDPGSGADQPPAATLPVRESGEQIRSSGDIQKSTCHVPGSGEADQEQDSVHHSGAGHHLHQSPGIVTSIDSDLELDMSLSAGSDRDSTEAHRA